MSERMRCYMCNKKTNAGPCPICAAVVCQLCAESEGESCCADTIERLRARCLAAEALVRRWQPERRSDMSAPELMAWDAWLAAGGRLEEP